MLIDEEGRVGGGEGGVRNRGYHPLKQGFRFVECTRN